MELWIIAVVLCIVSFTTVVSVAIYIQKKDFVRIGVTLGVVPVLLYGLVASILPIVLVSLVAISIIQVLLLIERVSA